MSADAKKSKKAGFWYSAGKQLSRVFSGINGESNNEINRIENSAKDDFLKHLFMTDLREILKEFNLSDPEESIDPKTGNLVMQKKSLQQIRDYIKSKVKLVDLENYIYRSQRLTEMVKQGKILPSKVAEYAGFVAGIRQEIHWVQYKIIDVLIKEDKSVYDTGSYITFWLKSINENFYSFKQAVNNVRINEQRFRELGFSQDIFSKIINISDRVRSLFEEFYQLVKSAIYSMDSLNSFRDKFDELDDEFFVELREIRRYASGVDIDLNVKTKFGLLADIRKQINDLFETKFKVKLFIDDEKSLNQIARDCNNQDELTSNIAAIGTLIDKINVSELKSKLLRAPEDGSINILEQFLMENFHAYDPKIIKNLRNIITLRNQWPIHDNTPKGTKLVIEIYGKYPPDNNRAFWLKILDLYEESLMGLSDLFNTLPIA